jgi:hypothetical protein
MPAVVYALADPGQIILAYTAQPGSAALDALDILASWSVMHHENGQPDLARIMDGTPE